MRPMKWLAFCGFLLVSIVLVKAGLVAQAPPKPSDAKEAAMRKELDSLRARAQAAKSATKAQRESLLADWQQFAQKYNLLTHTTTVTKGIPTRIAEAEGKFVTITVDDNKDCPSLIEGTTVQCVRTDDGKTAHQCEYFCVVIPPKTGPKPK